MGAGLSVEVYQYRLSFRTRRQQRKESRAVDAEGGRLQRPLYARPVWLRLRWMM